MQHGDVFSIEGKGCTFVFVLDLRPVSDNAMAMVDPVEMFLAKQRRVNAAEKCTAGAVGDQGLAEQRYKEALRQQLEQLEKDYCSIVVRRKLRQAADAQARENLLAYNRAMREMNDRLVDQREEWNQKLDKMYEDNETESEPLFAQTSELQTMLDKLYLKKDELERSLNPQNYSHLNDDQLTSGKGSSTKAVSDHHTSADEEDHVNLGENNAPTPQGSPKAGAAAASAPKDAEDDEELFGDFDSDAEGVDKAAAPSAPATGKRAAADDSDDEPIAAKAKRQKIDLEAPDDDKEDAS